MLSPSTAADPARPGPDQSGELVEGERQFRIGLSNHEIGLGNSPKRIDPYYFLDRCNLLDYNVVIL